MKKSVLLILLLLLCTSSFITVRAAESEATSKESTEDAKAKAGDFYFAYFDVTTKDNIKVAIPNLVLRFYGTIESVKPTDLTEIVLTRDGVKVKNGVTYSNKVVHFQWGNEEVTDVYFSFNKENTEAGNYGLTGKFKGESFKVYNKIIEATISKKPALARDLTSVSWGFSTDENDNPKSVNEVVFHFKGLQNTFYPSNLKDLELTLDGKKISCSFTKQLFRYYEVNEDNTGDTSYNLILTKALTKPGTYCLTGKYRGKAFKSYEIIIPSQAVKEPSQDETTQNEDELTLNKGELELAYLARTVEDNRIVSIPGMHVRFYGHITSADLSDFTNIKLVKDGVVVKNSIELSGKGTQYDHFNKKFTDFYFTFKEDIVEPGFYSLTGKYKGKVFDAGSVFIEAPLSNEPADSKDLVAVSWCYYLDINNDPESINEVGFQFDGLQNQFNLSDLTDLKLTRNGKKISFELKDDVTRYYEANGLNIGYTRFHIFFQDALTKPGTYRLSGKYQGKAFTSIIDITIPE